MSAGIVASLKGLGESRQRGLLAALRSANIASGEEARTWQNIGTLMISMLMIVSNFFPASQHCLISMAAEHALPGFGLGRD